MARGSPQQIALLLRRKANALDRAIRQSEAESAAEALQIARELSSGGFSSAQLTAMGHPYAARAPRPPAPVHIINRQSGAFLAGWRVSGPRKTAAGFSTRIVNDSSHARLLLKGSRVMIARPIIAEIRKRAAAARAKRHRQALAAIHRTG